MSVGLCDEVRATCAQIAAGARSVDIDLEALGHVEPEPPPALDPLRHYVDGSPAAVASYFLALDAVNFGSGWFPTLRKRSGSSGYFTVAWAIADRFRAHGPWTNAQLRAMRTDEIADTLGQRRDHELMALYAQALRALGRFLGERDALAVVRAARGSAQALAAQLASGMALFADRGFYKRAQIVPANLALARVARFKDLRSLTIFADNLVPHVLRCDGVLRYDEDLATHIDAGRLLPAGAREREIRACAVHACELIARRVGVSEHELDNWLWSRGQAPQYKAHPRHRTRTVYY
ncbi:MAG: queuosine salvage family protein [Solirubrobacteraceae bacterium]|nr:queuosine salvage family protein [Solirubrobacteraceae bacterium]